MRIAYVGPFAFPSSNANSLRVKGVVEALAHCGHHVMVCPGQAALEHGTDASTASAGVEIHELNEYGGGVCSSFAPGVRGLFLGDVTLRWLRSLPEKPDVVILYGTHLGYLLRLIGYCRRASIRLLLDVVEWYDPRHLPGGVIGPFAVSNELSMRWAVPRADGLLVISSYLEKYYQARGCRTIRVPPIFSEFPPRPRPLREKNGLLNLCYAGTPGKKEEFSVLLEGVRRAVDAGVTLKLHIIGVTATEFLAKYPQISSLLSENSDAFEFYGRLPNQVVRQLVSSADFLLLARRPLRFANAGFPFKVAESMTLGTPVILNDFSDISEYLQDGINSFIMSSLNADEVFGSIKRAASLDEGARSDMRDRATKTAQRLFSAAAKATEVDEFIQRCSGRN